MYNIIYKFGTQGSRVNIYSDFSFSVFSF